MVEETKVPGETNNPQFTDKLFTKLYRVHLESGNITLTQFEKRLALDDDRFNVVIGRHIISSAFAAARDLSSSEVLQNEDKEICVNFSFSKSKCPLQSSLHHEHKNNHAHMLSKRHTFHPFLTFSNKEIFLVSLTELFLVVVDWVNYYCHLYQCVSLKKKPFHPKRFPDADR